MPSIDLAAFVRAAFTPHEFSSRTVFSSPLVLDLDGDGAETSATTYFDHAGDHFAEVGKWVSEDDGMLAIDLNGNGKIDSGAELFGNNTAVGDGTAANGFAALAQYDSNSDGVIDSDDADWGRLRVYRWTDADDDNYFDDGEGRLETLSANDVSSISLTYEASTRVSSGNKYLQVGSYTRTDGTTREVVDAWFKTRPDISKYVGPAVPAHSATIAALPDIEGSGYVPGLRDAMALDGAGLLEPPFYGAARQETRTLEQLVTAFKDATDSAARDVLAEKILHRWAGAEAANTADFGSEDASFDFTTPQRLAVVEAFMAVRLLSNMEDRTPGPSDSFRNNRSYRYFLEILRAELMAQTTLKDMFDAVTDSGGDDGLDYSGVLAVENADARKDEFLRSLAAISFLSPRVYEAMSRASSEWAYGLYYHGRFTFFEGLEGFGRQAGNFYGDGSSNTFRTSDGQSDSLRGSGGRDLYQLAPGTGMDEINEGFGGNSDLASTDTVMVAPGIAPSGVAWGRDGNDLVISLIDPENQRTDSFRVKEHYVSNYARIEKLEFEDGTAYRLADFADYALARGAGTRGADRFDAAIVAGPLGDTQRGGKGADRYLLGRGGGHEVIDETQTDVAGNAGDAIRLKAGLALSDVRLSREGMDLKVALVGDGGVLTDSLTVRNHFLRGSQKVESLEDSDGTRLLDLLSLQLGARVGNGDVGGILEGLGGGMADTFVSDAGSDTFQGKSGDDVYELGLGSGTDFVEEGYQNDVAGDGADTIRLGAGVTSSMARLRRTMWDLVVELVDSEGQVTDSLTVRDHFRYSWAEVERVALDDGTALWTTTDFDALTFTGPTYFQSSEAIRGTVAAENLEGHRRINDIFDSDAGGDDGLFGYGGDDEYRLGSGTGFDTIYEGYDRTHDPEDAGDLIRIKAGYGTDDVRLRRDNRHLWVELLGTAGADGVRPVTDSLKVQDQFASDVAKIESVVFADGTVWDSSDFHAVALRGTSGNEDIEGRDDLNDIFDSDAGGNDRLYGYEGGDEYRLGSGTGFDTIYEGHDRSGDAGDAGDLIKVEAGFGTGDVRLRRDQDSLWVELLGTAGADGVRPVTDSLKVDDYFANAASMIETVEFADGTVWGLAEFHAVALRGTSSNEDIEGRGDLDDIFDTDAGGNDGLYGYGGDDEYRLGTGTGLDTIYEGSDRSRGPGDAGDLIKVKSGFGYGDLRLRRDGNHLFVELLGEAGANGVRPVTDSLRVYGYYSNSASKVETVEFADGTVWGGSFVVGTDQGDDFTSTTDSETLHGGDGNDVYRFAKGFGDDRVVDTGGTDKVKIASHATSSLAFSREGDDMVMEAIGTNDRVKFDNWYADGGSRKVERIEAGNVVLLSAAAERMATAMASFISGGGTASDFVSRNHQDYWETISGTPGG